MPSQTRNILYASVLGFLVIVTGTVGYYFIEGWSILESLYMTVITVSTIGFGEIKPLNPIGRVFTLFIIVFGVGTVAYLAGQMTRVMVEGSVQRVLGRRMLEAHIKKLKNHYIICGFGRIGQMVANEIQLQKHDLVVLENDPDMVDKLEKEGIPFIKGDASEEENLLSAGIERAAGLISAVSSDGDNLYIVLTARSLNPDLFILSRASEAKSIKKLQGVGADRVVSPYLIGARKMAQALLRPTVADFLETTVHGEGDKTLELAMEEILVMPESKIKDVTLLDSNIRRDLDLIVIAIKTAGGRMLFNPSAQARINVGDTLIAVGAKENMERLVKMLGADVDTRRVHKHRHE